MRVAAVILLLSAWIGAFAETFAEYSVEESNTLYTGKFAPYFIGSLTHGKNVQGIAVNLDAKIKRDLRLDKRFSWGFGAEGLIGYNSKCKYEHWVPEKEKFELRSQGPAVAWLQQLYAEVKFRGVFLTVGMKEHESALYNQRLGSGDLVESGNSRPIPEVRIVFIDCQNIPFTPGWVQIQGEISYGKMLDKSYLKNHYNYYDYHLNLGCYYTYKRCYFRTNPSQPFSVTLGMQVGAMFGGETNWYSKGKVTKTAKFSSSLLTFFKMFLPMGENGEDYYSGSTLGSWDLKARYRLRNNDELYAYISWPWEDGSGIGRCNKWDGVWGFEYKSARRGWLTGFVAEYIDFRDQSGPIHWAPQDTPGTTITSQATGRDNYYNNGYYNSYAYYGMSIGTPFLMSPIYNLDGYPAFACNRTNGFHIGASGYIIPTIEYRMLLGYQRGLGNYTYPYYHARSNTSFMLEGNFDASAITPGLSMKAQLAFDCGALRGNNFGCCLSVTYKGKIGR